jgi:hypothetical protein
MAGQAAMITFTIEQPSLGDVNGPIYPALGREYLSPINEVPFFFLFENGITRALGLMSNCLILKPKEQYSGPTLMLLLNHHDGSQL